MDGSFWHFMNLNEEFSSLHFFTLCLSMNNSQAQGTDRIFWLTSSGSWPIFHNVVFSFWVRFSFNLLQESTLSEVGFCSVEVKFNLANLSFLLF